MIRQELSAIKENKGEMMKFKMHNTIWEIYEEQGRFWIYRNGAEYGTSCGYSFETESGACYAILCEYAV